MSARIPSCGSPIPDYAYGVTQSYIVTIGTKKHTRLLFEVMASSSSEAQERHEDLAEIGERVEVRPVCVDVDALRRGEAL